MSASRPSWSCIPAKDIPRAGAPTTSTCSSGYSIGTTAISQAASAPRQPLPQLIDSDGNERMVSAGRPPHRAAGVKTLCGSTGDSFDPALSSASSA
jgi:hypothetical protein